MYADSVLFAYSVTTGSLNVDSWGLNGLSQPKKFCICASQGAPKGPPGYCMCKKVLAGSNLSVSQSIFRPESHTHRRTVALRLVFSLLYFFTFHSYSGDLVYFSAHKFYGGGAGSNIFNGNLPKISHGKT